MAQPKRKRRTKHRGNAAGMVELRGRTGRPVPGGATSASKGTAARSSRVDRYSQPPTWRSAASRAAIATILFVVVVLVIGKPIATAVGIGLALFVLYIPIGFYTDSFFYKKRQQQQAAKKGKV